MVARQDIIDSLISYDPTADVDKVNKAIDFAIKYHGSQLRHSGDPYYYHPLEVALLITEMRLDTDSVVTAILHDTVEDTDLTYEDLEREFGDTIAKLVDGVTKLTKISFQPDHVRQAENFRKLLFAMSDDIRVLIVKLADRLHNMRTLHHISDERKRMRIALETAEIYAPLAERIGMQQYKIELHDISFGILHSDIRDSIVKRLDQLTEGQDQLIDDISSEMQALLTKAGVKCRVYGRTKTPYSIWMKMQMKNVGFDQLSDIIAFRMIVDDLSTCYQVLGCIHEAYSMVPDHFQDFISTPKANGYQSIHTIIIGPSKKRIEVQIRTQEMHDIAEMGVAAHWRYKQQYTNTDGKQYRWMRELISILETSADSEDFIQNTKMAMYYDQVFCFTPQGQLISLPKGATVVDFAYAVHSSVGDRCVGAKINERIVPLKTQLKNGDQIEIMTSKQHAPSPSWEQFVVTGKARAAIRKFIQSARSDEFSRLGLAILDKVLKNAGITDKEKAIDDIVKHFGKKNSDDLYAAIGEGAITKEQVLKFLKPIQNVIRSTLNLFSPSDAKTKSVPSSSKETKSKAVPIQGLVSGMAVHYARCCHPLPGENIVGVIHTGKGVTIHTTECDSLENLRSNPERIIELAWDNEVSEEKCYTTRLDATLTNSTGVLAAFASSIASSGSNIVNMKITNRSVDFFDIIVDIEVNSVEHFNAVISALQANGQVHNISKVKG